MVRVKQCHAEELDEVSANLVVDSLGCAVLVVDPEGRMARANTAFRRLFNAAPRELIGRGLDHLNRRFGAHGDLSGLLAEARTKGQAEVWLHAPSPHAARGQQILRCTARRIPAGRKDAYLLVFEDAAPSVPVDPHRTAELGHRVKNSLQIIAAFVAAEQRRMAGLSRASYAALRSRIVAVSTLYDVLSRSESPESLRGDRLLEALAEALRRALLDEGTPISLLVAAEPVWLVPEQTEAVGLLVNELATNAIKHAFPNGHGQIRLGLRSEAHEVVLEVSDNGVGIAADAASGLGSNYVAAFTRQLHGAFRRETGPGGTHYEVRFPKAVPVEPPVSACSRFAATI